MFSSTQLGEVMETQCDQCKSRFRLTETQLRQAYGKVRCGECGAIFNALLALKNYEGQLPPDYHQRQREEAAPQNEAEQTAADEREALSLYEAMYGHERRSFFSLGPMAWLIGILLLAALGTAQTIYYKRYQLIEDPRFQQQVIGLCKLLPCAQREFSSPQQIRLVERNVFTHPVVDNALMVTGSFVNQATFAQKMPDLLISLFDVQGRLIANRLFQAKEYLLEDRNRSVVPSKQQVQFRLEVVDPGTDALTYEFEFY